MASKIVVIGKGEFGNALAQGLELATIASTNSPVSVEQVSATEFLSSMTAAERAAALVDAAFVMYCGHDLSDSVQVMSLALQDAKAQSGPSKGGPLLEFIDWSNPDPSKNSYDGTVLLSSSLDDYQVVYKVTGVSYLDVAGNLGKQLATVYSNSNAALQPSLDIPGIVWKQADKNGLLSEVSDRLMTRADVDRWWDAIWLGTGVWLTGFGYVMVRYHEWFHGKYPWSMVPLYIADKAFGWTALWMMSAAPFAGNLLSIMTALSTDTGNGFDKILAIICAIIMIVPVFLFILPWITWLLLRSIFTSFDKKSNIKTMLVDMVSMRTEVGIIAFTALLSHAFMGSTVLTYKAKWYSDVYTRLKGEHELSMTCGILALTLVTILTIRSLIKEGSYMKLKPIYNWISPLSIVLATFHMIFMGYKGWNSLFNYAKYKGQPSPTFTTSMFSLGVVAVHIFLAIAGTKKRTSRNSRVEKHSATESAFTKYALVSGTGTSEATRHESFNDDA